MPTSQTRHYVVVREAGGGWDPAKALREQAGWDEHAAFMDALAEEGFIVVGGPLDEGRRALHIVRAASEDEIRRRLAEDPWEPMDVLRTATVEPWEILLGTLGR